MRNTKEFCWTVGFLLAFAVTACADERPSRIGSTVSSFELQSHRGKRWSLDDFSDSKCMVIAFLGTDCPLARLYGPRLAELHDEFASRGVSFVGINANTQNSLTEITAYVSRYNIPFPMLKDVGNRVADQIGAKRTPEVYLLDQNRRVRYLGRIDDQYGVGYSRDEVRRRDLAIALEELTTVKKCRLQRQSRLAATSVGGTGRNRRVISPIQTRLRASSTNGAFSAIERAK